MKGIILAAGRGASLYPATVPVCKPLITVYDKPLIYYPLTTLITAGITDILIITPPGEMEPFVRLFGDGEELGIRISYKEQKVQRGIADAFRVGRRFIGDDSVCLALGDNIFYHPDMERILKEARGDETGASVFAYFVDDPRPYGVVELDVGEVPVSLEEKPKRPKSNYAVPGLYFYDNSVVEIAQHMAVSARGELEITDVNQAYLKKAKLKVTRLPADLKWMDAGNGDSLLEAANTVRKIQTETGKFVGCPEEAALKAGLITKKDTLRIGSSHRQTEYGNYLLRL